MAARAQLLISAMELGIAEAVLDDVRRVREVPPSVRQADRHVPGRQAPVLGHGDTSPRRSCADAVRGVPCREQNRRRPIPGGGRKDGRDEEPPSSTQPTTCRITARSASPWSTTPACSPVGRTCSSSRWAENIASRPDPARGRPAQVRDAAAARRAVVRHDGRALSPVRVVVDTDLCEGHALCLQAAPDVFDWATTTGLSSRRSISPTTSSRRLRTRSSAVPSRPSRCSRAEGRR